jgi:hypothetical protein
MRRSALVVPVFLALLLATGRGNLRAQQPAPTPTLPPDPNAVVQAFFDALNQEDLAAATALFTDASRFEKPDACTTGCTDRAAIAVGIQSLLQFVPYTVTLEQAPATDVRTPGSTRIIARGQGSLDRTGGNYFQATFEVLGGRIALFHYDLSSAPCSQAPQPATVCLVTPTPIILLTFTPVAAQAQRTPAPGEAPRPTVAAVRSTGLPGQLELTALVLLGLVVRGLAAAAVGVAVRRGTRSLPR